MYHSHDTKHVHVPLGTANIYALLQDTGLQGCYAGWQVWSLQTCWPAKQERCRNPKFCSCNFSKSMGLNNKEEPDLYWNNEIVSWYRLYQCFSLHFNTFKTISIVQLHFQSGHPIVFNNLQGKQTVYSCRPTQQYYI